jgi:hypothetical protein
MAVVRLNSMTRSTGSQFDWNFTFSFTQRETGFSRIAVTASMVGDEAIAMEGYHDKIARLVTGGLSAPSELERID